jgi:nucleotide-binding universal stress UspA family protein
LITREQRIVEFHNILIPVAGIETDQGTVELAYKLLPKKNKGKIYAVYVIPIERTLPLDAEIESEIRKADEILNHTEKIAEEQGHKIETDLLQARDIGPAIINEALERQADLILMGVVYKTRFGKYSLGDVVPYVLENAPCPVILYNQPGK